MNENELEGHFEVRLKSADRLLEVWWRKEWENTENSQSAPHLSLSAPHFHHQKVTRFEATASAPHFIYSAPHSWAGQQLYFVKTLIFTHIITNSAPIVILGDFWGFQRKNHLCLSFGNLKSCTGYCSHLDTSIHTCELALIWYNMFSFLFITLFEAFMSMSS